jgi:hypothetical protein
MMLAHLADEALETISRPRFVSTSLRYAKDTTLVPSARTGVSARCIYLMIHLFYSASRNNISLEKRIPLSS